MNTSLLLVCLWAIVANVIALFPSRRNHWPAAYLLIAVGIPLLGFVTYENGPVWGLLTLCIGASMLRWPVYYLGRWVVRQVRPSQS